MCNFKPGNFTGWGSEGVNIIIIIMYTYHALIKALSAHRIHINPNMILYTHVEHSPTKTIYIKYYIYIYIMVRWRGRRAGRRQRSQQKGDHSTGVWQQSGFICSAADFLSLLPVWLVDHCTGYLTSFSQELQA